MINERTRSALKIKYEINAKIKFIFFLTKSKDNNKLFIHNISNYYIRIKLI